METTPAKTSVTCADRIEASSFARGSGIGAQGTNPAAEEGSSWNFNRKPLASFGKQPLSRKRMDKEKVFIHKLKRLIIQNLSTFEDGIQKGTISFKRKVYKGIRFDHPLVNSAFSSPIKSNLKNLFRSQEALVKLQRLEDKGGAEYVTKAKEIVAEVIANHLLKTLKKNDIPSSIWPTSVAYSEAPNYYIQSESYDLITKLALLKKLNEFYWTALGQAIYGVYLGPKPGKGLGRLAQRLSYRDSPKKLDYTRILPPGFHGRFIRPFEFLFFFMDSLLTLLKEAHPLEEELAEILASPIELLTVRGKGRKKFYEHYVIPGQYDLFDKYYSKDENYCHDNVQKRMISNLRLFFASFLPQAMGEADEERVHALLNELAYHLLMYKTLNRDTILSLIEVKLKLSDARQIYWKGVLDWT